ncbi:MAG: GTPase [Candidatus Hydrothermarchaeales archaeon]
MLNFKRVPPILTPDELLDIAFRRAAKAGKEARSKEVRRPFKVKKGEDAKVKVASQEVMGNFKRIVNRTSEIYELSPFYRELIAAIVDIEEFKRSLSALKWVMKTSEELEKKYRYKIRTSRKKEDFYRHTKTFYGQLSSILRKIKGELRFLAESREKLKNLPTVEDTFTAVIAGAPNVGKSTLLKAMTSAEPRVESYPFTTQKLLLGYFERHYYRYQVIDTPGLLDRPLKDRSPIELQGILALKYLADMVLFVFDPSETCGFLIDSQINLYRDIKERFEVKVVPVLNKADHSSGKKVSKLLDESISCSALSGEGVGDVIDEIVSSRAEG